MLLLNPTVSAILLVFVVVARKHRVSRMIVHERCLIRFRKLCLVGALTFASISVFGFFFSLYITLHFFSLLVVCGVNSYLMWFCFYMCVYFCKCLSLHSCTCLPFLTNFGKLLLFIRLPRCEHELFSLSRSIFRGFELFGYLLLLL